MNDKFSNDPTKHEREVRNLDPISNAPGAHPVGTGIGTAIGAAAGIGGVGAAALSGAATGAVAGPVGAAAGLVVGGVLGALLGKAAAEKIDPTEEDHYWRSRFSSEPYYDNSYSYDHYGPAYGIGTRGALQHEVREFDAVETELQREYESDPMLSRLTWDKARTPAKSAWDRVKNRLHSSN